MICNLWDNTPSVLFFVFSRHSSPIALYPCPGKIEELLTTVTSVMTNCWSSPSVVIFTLLFCCKMLIYSYKMRVAQNVLTAVKSSVFRGGASQSLRFNATVARWFCRFGACII